MIDLEQYRALAAAARADTSDGLEARERLCDVAGCEKKHLALGLCSRHYRRLRETGSTDDPEKLTVEQRFWAKVEPTGFCWNWAAPPNSTGYGQFAPIRGRKVLAHRFAYEALIGPIADGLYLDHLCRNRLCVNPDHLEPVTNRENLLRGFGFSAQNARKTECDHGHRLAGDNLKIDSEGYRRCRACSLAVQRRKRSRQANAARGVCPVCGDEFNVTETGRLFTHASGSVRKGEARPRCPGSLQRPSGVTKAEPPERTEARMQRQMVGRNVKLARERAAWTQRDLSRALGVSPASLYAWECGRCAVSDARARAMAAVLGIPLEAITGTAEAGDG